MNICEIDYSDRRRGIYSRLSETSTGGYFTTDLTNIRYLTGFRGTKAALLLVDGAAHLFLDSRYPGRSQASLEAGEDLEVVPVERGTKRLNTVCDKISQVDINSLQLERNRLSYQTFRRLVAELPVDNRNYGKDWVRKLRLKKDEAEIELIREAVKRTLEVFELLESWVEPGITEKDLNRSLRRELEARSEERSFYPLVLMGTRTAYPHAPPSEYELKPGDSLLVDVGLRVEGYCSDLTRMFFCDSGDSKRELYELSRRAANSLCDCIEPGVEVSSLAAKSANIFVDAGFGEQEVLHGPGHGVGLEIHEPPSLSRENRGELESGMVVTIEPGLYREGAGGGRIEHMVHVTDSGAEVLDEQVRL